MVGKDSEWRCVYLLTTTSISTSQRLTTAPSFARRGGRPGWSRQRAQRCVSFQRLRLVQTDICVFIHHCVSLPPPHRNVTTNMAALNSTRLLPHNLCWGLGAPPLVPGSNQGVSQGCVSPGAWLGEDHVRAL